MKVVLGGVEERLEKMGVTDLFIVGLAMDYWMKEMALDAKRLRIGGWVVKEGERICESKDILECNGLGVRLFVVCLEIGV